MRIERQPKYRQKRRSLQQLAKVAVSICSGVKPVTVKAPVLKDNAKTVDKIAFITGVIGCAQAGFLARARSAIGRTGEKSLLSCLALHARSSVPPPPNPSCAGRP